VLNAVRESLGEEISLDRERFVSAFEKKVPLQNIDNGDANSS
jgi:hypothetical protein